MRTIDRRRFVTSASAAAAVGALAPKPIHGDEPRFQASAAGFPHQDPELVQGVVGASHANFDRVKELVERYPELAKSAWDWGFGDWESALGAASHTGRREIALLLIEHGARPTLFSAAMLGQVDVVRALVEASPGIQRTPGPHGIPLLSHAQAGGEHAAQVHDYLLELGDAGLRPETEPIADEAKADLVGSYRYGTGENDLIVVTQRDSGALFVARQGGTSRGLSHKGDRVFAPAGAPSVHVAFTGPAAADAVAITYGGSTVTGSREG